MNGTICVLGQTITLPVIKNAKPVLVAPKIINTNLCKEIILPMFAQPKPKYKFSRSKWYEVEFHWTDYDEIVDWCKEQFGPHDNQPDAWSRWVHTYEDQIHFRDQNDYVLFVLRWS